MKKILIFLFAFVSMTTFATSGEQPNVAVPISLRVCTIDPTILNGGPQRTPIQPPLIYIEDGTLTFATPCDGCELRLVNAEDEVEYTTVISGPTLELPSDLSGTYVLEIICGDYVFIGEITL